MTKVVVTADQLGNVVGVSANNPEYGYVRVEQTTTQINDQGWLRPSKRSALIKGLVKDLIEAGFKQGKELPGKIVVVESLTPFNQDNPDRDLKVAGTTGVICTIDDQPIYRQAFYTTNENSYDQLITHNNTEEIKEVIAAQRAMTSGLQSLKSRTAAEATL
jgi:hypothetical protein